MRQILTLMVAATSLLAWATSCGSGKPDTAEAACLAERLECSLAEGDSLVATVGAIEEWIGAMDAVQAVEARRLLMKRSGECGIRTRAVMMTVLNNAYWAGWELSKECCDSILGGSADLTKAELLEPMQAARLAYLARGRRGECARFDLAFQDYIDRLPIVQQMRVYARVSSVERIAEAINDLSQNDPVRANEAVAALRQVLGKDEFDELANIVKGYVEI